MSELVLLKINNVTSAKDSATEAISLVNIAKLKWEDWRDNHLNTHFSDISKPENNNRKNNLIITVLLIVTVRQQIHEPKPLKHVFWMSWNWRYCYRFNEKDAFSCNMSIDRIFFAIGLQSNHKTLTDEKT